MTLARHDDTIETDRLVLRRMTEADLPFYTRIHSDPEVARYIGPGRPRTVEETRRWFDLIIETYERFGLGQLAVVRKADGALVGRCGTSFLEVGPSPPGGGDPPGYFTLGEAPAGMATTLERELGYTFDRPAWGHGFAREAARGVHAYVIEKLGVERVVSLIHPLNERSIRVARSLGARHVDRVHAFDAALDRYVWPAKAITG